MEDYYVNQNAQRTGEHEVHRTYAVCQRHADPSNQRPLGQHPNCQSAIAAAKLKYGYTNVDGCAYCVPDCHTR